MSVVFFFLYTLKEVFILISSRSLFYERECEKRKKKRAKRGVEKKVEEKKKKKEGKEKINDNMEHERRTFPGSVFAPQSLR